MISFAAKNSASVPLLLLLLAIIARRPHPAAANDNGLALTPPLGWRSWNLYHRNVNQPLMERIMRGVATDRSRSDHAGTPTSLLDLGYADVGLDDFWQACDSPDAADGMHYHREDGSPIVNANLFPDLGGMVELAHSLNLTAGWYGNNCICADVCRNPDECDKQIEADVRAIVNFDFDGWKLDGCGGETNLPLFEAYIRKLSPAKPILVENCHWGNPAVPYYKPNRTLPPSEGCPWNYYRSSGDIGPSYGSVLHNLGTVETFRAQNLSYPGCWAYPDMMQVGVTVGKDGGGEMALTAAETRSHFASWCIVSSPLVLSHDVNDEAVTDAVWDVISNREAIAVNQAYAGDSGGVYDASDATIGLYDHLGVEVTVVPTHRYLSKPLGDGKGVAVLLMNSGEDRHPLEVVFKDVPDVGCSETSCSCLVRDIWAHRDLGQFVGSYNVNVESHDAAFLLVTDCSTVQEGDIEKRTGVSEA